MPSRRIARPDRCHQAVPDVVGEARRVLLVLERSDRHDRPEDLLLSDRHPVVDLREHGRWIERAFALERLAAGDNLSAFLAAPLDEAVHLVAVLGRDQRANLSLGLERVAHL